jgi:hypothetical protein
VPGSRRILDRTVACVFSTSANRVRVRVRVHKNITKDGRHLSRERKILVMSLQDAKKRREKRKEGTKRRVSTMVVVQVVHCVLAKIQS